MNRTESNANIGHPYSDTSTLWSKWVFCDIANKSNGRRVFDHLYEEMDIKWIPILKDSVWTVRYKEEANGFF